MRISGLASGMDIDTLVQNMMKPTQLRIDKVLQQKTKGQWAQEAYNDVNATLAKFVLDRRTDFGLTASTSTGLTVNRSTESFSWVKAATASDTSVVGVSANAAAVDGTYQIKVDRLAANYSAASSAALPKVGTNADGSPKADTLANQFSLGSTAIVDFTVSTDRGKIRVTSNQNATAVEGVKLVKIDPQTTSLKSIAASLNEAGIGVKASYDAGIQRFFLQTADSGSANTLSIEDASTGLGSGVNGFLAARSGSSLLKMSGETGKVTSGVTYAGVDALLDVGAAKGITQSSNEFSINGVSLSLHQVGSTTVQVSTDVNSAFDKIKKFVDEYNKMIDGLNGKLNEKYDKDYQPLTDAERAAMSDDLIEKWEEKAKTGLLSGSQELSGMISSIRLDMISSVEGVSGKYNSLSSIGIGTAPYSLDGKLVINEAELRTALQDDADGVMQLLFKNPDPAVTDRTTQKKQTGLVNRLFGDVIDGMKSIISKAGTGENASLYRSVQATMLIDFVTQQSSVSVIDKDISGYQKRLNSLSDSFTATQTRYYNQFTVMEQAIERANQQSTWLSQQISGMSGGN